MDNDRKSTELLFGHCNLGKAELSLFGSCTSAYQWRLTIAASKCLKKSLLF